MEPGSEHNGATPQMRRKTQLMRSRKGRYPLRLGNTAANCRIRLQYVDATRFDVVAKIEAGHQAFTTCNGDVRRPAKFGLALQVVGRNRLFEPV